MKVLITGATGGLGSHLVEAFTHGGHEVTGLARTLGSAGHLAGSPAAFVTGDVTDASSLTEAWFRADCVVHTAAKVGGSHRWHDHLATDLQGTANVLQAAERAGCRRFVLISSIAVLDLPADGSTAAADTGLRSRVGRSEHYVRSKLMVENLARKFHEQGRLAVTIVRPSVFVGRYDRHLTPSVLRFLRSAYAGLIGAGDNLIPCVDLAELAALVVRAAVTPRAAGRTYQVSGQDGITQLELLEMHARNAGRTLRPRYSRRRARAMASALETGVRWLPFLDKPLVDRFMVDVATLNCNIDCSGAAEDLGWRGSSDLRDSVRQSIAWFKENAS